MSTAHQTDTSPDPADDAAPTTLGRRIRQIGPGLVMAATGVGVGDLVSATVAGEKYGYAFVWAFVLAAILKYYLTEALGRFTLVTRETIVDGWRRVGRWAVLFVVCYLVMWSFTYGAAGPSTTGLALAAAFPVLDSNGWAVISSLLAFALVISGRYKVLESVMKVMVGLMFASTVALAILIQPDWGDFASGVVPSIPDGSMLYAVGIVGGLGGSLALCAYGYWIQDKGWHSRSWLPVMRLDSVIGYVATAIFALSVLIVGAEFLHGSGQSVDGSAGLLALTEPLAAAHGPVAKWLLLVGFWSVAFSSVIGVWSGMSYLFADIVRSLRHGGRTLDQESRQDQDLTRTWAYRGFLVLLTFPTIPLILVGSPVQLVMIWVVMGAFFLPFLAATLLYLLNSPRFGVRSAGERWFTASNVVLTLALVVFLVLMVQQVVELATGSGS